MDVDNSDKLTPSLTRNDRESKLVAAGKIVANKSPAAGGNKQSEDNKPAAGNEDELGQQ